MGILKRSAYKTDVPRSYPKVNSFKSNLPAPGTPYHIEMASRDGDENGPGRRPRVNQPAVADGQGPADWSDGEDDVDDDIVNDDDAEEDTDDDSEDSEDGDENEDIFAHIQYVQLQRDLRKQGLITENAELTADKMEAEVTLV